MLAFDFFNFRHRRSNSSHLCFHILKQLHKLSSVLQLIEGPLSMNEGLAIVFVVSLACLFTAVGRLTPVSSVGLLYI